MQNKSKKSELLIGRERDIDTLCQNDKGAKIVRIIRGQRCDTEQGLFQEWAAALQFPYYFGNNWAAFDECINDLYWFDGAQFKIFITNLDKLLVGSDKQLSIFTDLLQEAAENWSKGSYTHGGARKGKFEVLFHCEKEKAEALQKRLRATGNEMTVVDLPATDSRL